MVLWLFAGLVGRRRSLMRFSSFFIIFQSSSIAASEASCELH